VNCVERVEVEDVRDIADGVWLDLKEGTAAPLRSTVR